MFIATSHPLKYSSLREERNFFPAGQHMHQVVALLRSASLIARLQAINISPRWGEIRQQQLVAFKLELANDKWKISSSA
jgi:hypothetical protein